MKLRLVACLSLLTLLLSAQNNIQWRGTDRSGIYQEAGLLKSWPADGPQLLWHFDDLDQGFSSPAIDSDKIYITGMSDGKGYIYVLDLNGKLLNKKEYGPDWDTNYHGPRGTVTVNDGHIYLISGMGGMYCFDQQTLALVWQQDLLKKYNATNIEWGLNEAPLIVGNKVIATPGGKKENIIALDKKTGELIWSTPAKGDIAGYCSPLYIGDQQVPLIVTMTADHIVGVNAETGEMLWAHENKNRWSVHANTPVYGDGMILCTSGYGRGSTMLRLLDGGRKVEEAWFLKDLDNRIGAMVKIGDYAYGSGDNNRFWFVVNWKTGEIVQKEKGLAMGNIIANDGMLYLYTDKGEMVLAKATPGKMEVVSKFDISLGTEQHWAHTVLYKGVMYVRHGNTLMAYKVK